MIAESEDTLLRECHREGADLQLGAVQLCLELRECAIVVVRVGIVLRLHDVDGEVYGIHLEGDTIAGLDALNSSLDEVRTAACAGTRLCGGA